MQELLDQEKIFAVLEPHNLARLRQLEIFHTINSTNTYLLEQAKRGASSATACLAEQQTQGRGRLGRPWYSPFAANLYFSFLWRFDAALDISGLSIAVAVMLIETLRKYGIGAGLQLKWPNDVLFAQRKLAGILLECNVPGSVVIGIGVNLDVSSAQEKSWIDLTEVTGASPRRNFLAGLLLNELLEKLPQYAEHGLQPFLAEWRQHDVLLNQAVKVHTPEKIISGIMRGINEQGELVLQTENGELQQFCYGEVSVRQELEKM